MTGAVLVKVSIASGQYILNFVDGFPDYDPLTACTRNIHHFGDAAVKSAKNHLIKTVINASY